MGAGTMLRSLAQRFGYRLEKQRFQRYGIDPIVDIARLSERFGVGVHRIFDVGANVGQTAIAFQAAFPRAEIFCFEPVQATLQQLRASIAGFERIRAFNLALSDKIGEAELHLYESSLLSSLEARAPFTADRSGPAAREACRTDTLDSFCETEGIDSIDVLKIDTEGHDLAVLRGAGDLLTAGRIGFVLAEFNRLDGEIGSLVALADLLGAFGYSFIASYIDDVFVRDRPLVVGNALFVRDPR